MLGFDKLQFPPPEDWTAFQDLSRDLTAARHKLNNVQNLGRSGQEQFGVDHIGCFPNGNILGVQCKKKDVVVGYRLTVDELVKEVNKAKRFDPPLSQYVIATTSKDDAKLQMEAAKLTQAHKKQGLFEVQVEGWDTIKSHLANHPHVTQKYFGYPVLTEKITFAFESSHIADAIPPTSKPRSNDKPLTTSPLSPTTHHAFGLLASIGVTLTKEMLASLVPQYDWPNILRQLSKRGLVESTSQGYEVPQKASKAYFSTALERRSFDQEWAEVLAPLAGHIDTGIILSSVLFRLGQISEGIEILSTLAESVEPGHWNTVILELIHFLLPASQFSRLSTTC